MPQSKAACNILLAVDGSEHSFAAAALLTDLPLPQACQVTALGASSPRDPSSQTKLFASLNKVQYQFEKRGIRAVTEIVSGPPAQVLAEYAEQHPIDLIVLGAKGLRHTLGIFLGGVAQQVVEYSKCPVMVVRAPFTGLQKILLVTDGSDSSERAASYTGSFPFPAGIHLDILHILPPVPIGEASLVIPTWSARFDNAMLLEPELAIERTEIEKQEEHQGNLLVQKTIARLKAQHPVFQSTNTVSGAVVRGDAATEIVKYVKQNEVNLVIAGSRGLSQVSSWLLGSVSRKLLHYAGCSVLIVRGLPPAPASGD